MKTSLGRHYKRWTVSEKRALEFYWECGDRMLMSKIPGRKLSSIVAMGIRGLRLGPRHRGSGCSNSSLSVKLGYSRETIKMLANRLRIRRRLGRWPLEAVDLMIEELDRLGWPPRPNDNKREKTGGEWGGTKPDRCLCCQSTDRRHASRGLCHPCDRRLRRHGVELPPMISRIGEPYPITEWPLLKVAA